MPSAAVWRRHSALLSSAVGAAAPKARRSVWCTGPDSTRVAQRHRQPIDARKIYSFVTRDHDLTSTRRTLNVLCGKSFTHRKPRVTPPACSSPGLGQQPHVVHRCRSHACISRSRRWPRRWRWSSEAWRWSSEAEAPSDEEEEGKRRASPCPALGRKTMWLQSRRRHVREA